MMMTLMTMMTIMTMMTMMTMMTTLNIRHQRWWLRKNLDLGMKRSTTRSMLSPHFSHKWVINTIRLVRIVGGGGGADYEDQDREGIVLIH